MITAFKRPKLKRSARMRFRSFCRALFVFVVIALIPFVMIYLIENRRSGLIKGWVETETENIGPATTARVASIHVKPGQEVSPGTVLVTFDMVESGIEQMLNRAKLKDYEYSSARYTQELFTYQQKLREAYLKSRMAVQEATVALEKQKMNQTREQAELEGIQSEIKRISPLVEKRLLSETELSSLRPKAEALTRTLSRYGPLITALQNQLDQAQKNQKDTSSLLAETEKNISSHTVSNGNTSISGIMTGKESSFSLKATSAGIVSHIFHQKGDIVAGGEPVLRLTAQPRTRYITGWVAPSNRLTVHPGDIMQVLKTGEPVPSVPVKAEVIMIAPEIMDLFEPANPAPRYPTRGLKIRLRIMDSETDLIPGEPILLAPLSVRSYKKSIKDFFSLWKKPIQG